MNEKTEQEGNMERPSARIIQINFVVKDLEKAKESWSRLLGEPLIEYNQSGPEEVPAVMDGKMVDCSDVTGLKYVLGDLDWDDMMAGKKLADNVFFIAFWKPGTNDTPWKRFLDTHGEGIMDIEMEVDSREKAYEAIGKKPYHSGYFPNATYSLVECMDTFYTDLNINCRENNDSIREELLKK